MNLNDHHVLDLLCKGIITSGEYDAYLDYLMVLFNRACELSAES